MRSEEKNHRGRAVSGRESRRSSRLSRMATASHADTQEHLQELLEGINAVVWEVNQTLRFHFVSRQAERMFGYPPAEWTDTPDFWRVFLVAEDYERCLEVLRNVLETGTPHDMEWGVRTREGRVVWTHAQVAPIRDATGSITGVRGFMVDITALKDAEKKLQYLVAYDELTGLPNRNLFKDRLRQVIGLADRGESQVAVLFLDLDRFKNINDSLGHGVGDSVLRTAAGRLLGIVRKEDTVARPGGDEFLILLAGMGRIEDIVDIARQALEVLSQPFSVGDRSLFVTASIGISVFPRDGKDVPTLFKHADAAMYRAKEGGKNRFEFFTAEMNAAAMHRLQLESMLRQALKREEFVLHYQPQADIKTGRVVGIEALVRWRHPELGMVPPAEFIPLAEETGLIVPLGSWVLETACRQVHSWNLTGMPQLRLAVNVSMAQFAQSDFDAIVERILQDTGLPPHMLDLELTESLFMQEAETMVQRVNHLRRLGVRLAVDDFGTGYSSLSYLQRFPVTAVKIDRSFVRNSTSDPASAALVRSIIGMAHELRLRVIAEGVETEAQLQFLASHHCDEVQGYLLSQALPAQEFSEFCLKHPGLPGSLEDFQHGERVLLLVDDEVNITTSLKRLFRQDGYRILTASSGQEGLELLAEHRPGVIVSDQRMPEMSGVEFMGRVKDIYPETVRIMLSGYTELKSVTEAINRGAIYKFLTKPWDDEQLRDQVREAFTGYELKQENVRLARELARANGELSEVNKALEVQIAEKSETLQHNIGMLQVSQEILEYLPAAVIGIDNEGLVVLSNRKAEEWLAKEGRGSLLGFNADECLPKELAAVAMGTTGQSAEAIVNGRRFRAVAHRMGAACRSQGSILMFFQV
jgi:diguanylate cyclase (GGDEF)-like protein/PAS domain S-box-containing protein